MTWDWYILVAVQIAEHERRKFCLFIPTLAGKNIYLLAVAFLREY